MKNNKYRLIPEDCKTNYGRKLYRIKALKDFGVVKAGELGGFIVRENNLSYDGEAWVCENAEVFDNARICNDARIYGKARIYGDAIVRNKATIGGNALIYDNALICDDAWIYDNAYVYGNAKVFGKARVYDKAYVCGNVLVYNNTIIHGNAIICGDIRVCNNAIIGDNAVVSGDAIIEGNATICENARVYGNAIIRGNALVCGNAAVCNNAVLGDNEIIEKDTDWFVIGPIGSRNGFTTFSLNKDKSIYVFCGCFHGNIDEFEKAVEETHKGTKYEEEYKLAIALAKKKITTVKTNKMTELTNEYKDSLIDKAKKNIYVTPDNKAITITATFPCGWIISSTANVVSGQGFVEEKLCDKCLDDIKSKVWELERYRKTVDNYKKTLRQETNENEV